MKKWLNTTWNISKKGKNNDEKSAVLLVPSDTSKTAFVLPELYKHIVICLRTDNVTGVHVAGAFVFYQKNFGTNNPTYKR